MAGCGYEDCLPSEGLLFTPVGFTRAELDTIVIRKFAKGQIPAGLIDSLVLDSSTNHYEFSATGDTARPGPIYVGQLMHSGYDYQIYFPSANKLVTVAEIYEPQQRRHKTFPRDESFCGNRIQSCQLDGVLVQPNYTSHENIYIRR
jgi:hypothetical protein